MKISICTINRNRLDNLLISLESWLRCEEVSEVVVLDYGSTERVKIDHSKVKVYRVEADKFNMSRANNICFDLAKGDVIIKADADHVFNKNFIPELSINENEFITGEAVKLYLDGFVCLWKKDFEKVNGYNERFVRYGNDDIDFYRRLEDAGLTMRKINPDWITHIDHDDNSRIKEFGFTVRTKKQLDYGLKENWRSRQENPWVLSDKRSRYHE